VHAEALGRALASGLPAGATAVLSPALGGLIIGHEVARALGVRAIFAERQDGALTLRRGFSLSPDDRVVVIEDVVTTGGSTRETMDVVRKSGATVVAAGSIVDRSAGGTSSPPDLPDAVARGGPVAPLRSGGLAHSVRSLDGVPFHALVTLSLPTYQPDACPLCAKGLAVTKPGSRT
jgi:orotate phosphoribosyltransferase